ncbi:hypothetical protein HAX54_000218 [Datura stramonium]|uniref:Uncharacterized protein n=1 Tax=Datura stramonium TaxID=4076 RepID=A0ABS8WRY4_DATST|nr:hypothetical protein [Datura stramonium]
MSRLLELLVATDLVYSWRLKSLNDNGPPEPLVRYHSGRARILTLYQDINISTIINIDLIKKKIVRLVIQELVQKYRCRDSIEAILTNGVKWVGRGIFTRGEYVATNNCFSG